MRVSALFQDRMLTEESAPEKIEADLMRIVPRERWILLSHQVIWHGRRICFAHKPACDTCPLAPHCPSAQTGRGRADAVRQGSPTLKKNYSIRLWSLWPYGLRFAYGPQQAYPPPTRLC